MFLLTRALDSDFIYIYIWVSSLSPPLTLFQTHTLYFHNWDNITKTLRVLLDSSCQSLTNLIHQSMLHTQLDDLRQHEHHNNAS